MTTQARPFNPWPYGIIAVFVIFIASFAAVVAYISQHNMDLVSADYYEQEIRYQGRLDELNRTAGLRAATRLTFDPATRLLSISLPPAHAASRPHGILHLYRPSAAGLDRQLKLSTDATGVQHFNASDLQPGHWKARLHWTSNGQDYFAEESLLIPPPVAASRP
jgi:nitrogen fixation protein FixH